jgi:hypothetical protein
MSRNNYRISKIKLAVLRAMSLEHDNKQNQDGFMSQDK